MTTIVTEIGVRKTELYSRQRLFDNVYGIKIPSGITTTDISLELDYEIYEINNFLLISTDSTIDLKLERLSDIDNSIVEQINFQVSGVFLTYSNFAKITLKRNGKINRIPKVTIIHS